MNQTNRLLLLAALAAACSAETGAPTTGAAPAPAAAPAPDAPATATGPAGPTTAARRAPTATPRPQPAAETPPPDWSPSSGKELARAPKPEIDREAAKRLGERGMRGFAAKPRDCDAVVDDLSRAMAILDLKPNAKTRPVFRALSLCARRAHRYRVLQAVALLARKAGTGYGSDADLAIAYIGLQRYAEAEKELGRALRAEPKNPELLAAAARLRCQQNRFGECRKLSEAAIAAARGARDPEATLAGHLAHITRWQATTALGDFEAARASVAALPEKLSKDRLEKILTRAELHGILVDPDVQRTIPVGTYHLAGSVNRAPVLILVAASGKKPRNLRISVGAPGVTETTTRTVVAMPGKPERLGFTPPLAAAAGLAALTAPRATQFDVRVEDTATREVLFEQSLPAQILPRSYLPTAEKLGDSRRVTLHNTAAWVTPNVPAVEEFLTAAKKRLVKRPAFAGEQRDTVEQVQAIYDELKARGVSYVMDPDVGTDRFLGQRTRLPAEILASTNAQCLEGTILFAALLEAIGLKPILVFVPGHAFVGWHATAKDGVPAGTPLFLETTMIASAPFEAAVKKAMSRVREEEKKGTFARGQSQMLELTELRARGISPQPL